MHFPVYLRIARFRVVINPLIYRHQAALGPCLVRVSIKSLKIAFLLDYLPSWQHRARLFYHFIYLVCFPCET